MRRRVLTFGDDGDRADFVAANLGQLTMRPAKGSRLVLYGRRRLLQRRVAVTASDLAAAQRFGPAASLLEQMPTL